MKNAASKKDSAFLDAFYLIFLSKLQPNKDYESIKKYLAKIIPNLSFEEVAIQLQKNQAKYQIANKAFHSTLELLDT